MTSLATAAGGRARARVPVPVLSPRPGATGARRAVPSPADFLGPSPWDFGKPLHPGSLRFPDSPNLRGYFRAILSRGIEGSEKVVLCGEAGGFLLRHQQLLSWPLNALVIQSTV